MKAMQHLEGTRLRQWRRTVCFLIMAVLCLTAMVPALAETGAPTIDPSVLLRKNSQDTARQHLSPDEQKVYDYLKEQVLTAVTTGGKTSIEVPVTDLVGEVITLNEEEYSKLYDAENDSYDLVREELKKRAFDFLHPIFIALESDEPGLFFWEKGSLTVGDIWLARFGSGRGAVAHVIKVNYPVLEEYRFVDKFKLEALAQGAAQLADAQQIISKYASASDYEKVRGYVGELIALATYKKDPTKEGNDRNLVKALDGDPDTGVVCVGFARAFDYLCSQTVFDSPLVNCMFIAGLVEGTNSYHAWNVVTMDDGKNYLVDTTFIDSDGEDRPYQYFLRGQAGGSLEEGYLIQRDDGGFWRYINGNGTLTDMDCLKLYGAENLTLAEADYPQAQQDREAQWEELLSRQPRLIAATPGVASSEGAENLFDGNVGTKWCVSMKNGPVFVEWQQPEPIALHRFLMATANDNSRFPGRNPSSWTLSARNSTDEEWKVLWSKEKNDFMQDEDYKAYVWVLNYGDAVPPAYSFFRLEITESQGADVLQLSRVEILQPED